MEIGVDDLCGSPLEQFRCQKIFLQPPHILLIHLLSEIVHRSSLRLMESLVMVTHKTIDPFHDAGCVRVHDLTSIIVIGLEAIVLRGIVACCQDNPAISPQLSERKRKLRCGSGAFKQVGIASQL